MSNHGGIAVAIDRAHGAEGLGAAEELGSGGASHGLQACTVGAGDRRPGEAGGTSELACRGKGATPAAHAPALASPPASNPAPSPGGARRGGPERAGAA